MKADTSEGSYFTASVYSQPTGGGSPVKLRAFAEPGACEVRYVSGGDGKTLARAALEIHAP